MALPTTKCFAGRIIVRHDGLHGLVWDRPCLIPTEVTLPTEPPMYFCVQHGQAVFEQMYEALDATGLIDHDVVLGPQDEFDELMLRLGPLEGQ